MTGKEYKFMPSVGCHTKIIIYLVSLYAQYAERTLIKTAITLNETIVG